MEELRKITYGQAIREAIDEEMARDENVILFGEDVGVMGGNWTTSQGLMDKYGEWRVRDTPISENGFTGLAIGAAFFGARPIVEIMFADFMMVCFDMLENEMCKYSYMTGGQVSCPLVVRAPMGAGRSSAANHSQSPTAFFAHTPRSRRRARAIRSHGRTTTAPRSAPRRSRTARRCRGTTFWDGWNNPPDPANDKQMKGK